MVRARRACSAFLLLWAAATATQGLPDEPTEKPIDVGHVEETKVNLVLLDAVVLDSEGRTVPGLTREDFEIVVGRKVTPVDTLDVSCTAEATEDARGVRRPQLRATPPAGSAPRKIVLALDYLHLQPSNRVETLQRVRDLFDAEGVEGDEWMLVALTGGLRIEQPWTRDRTQVKDVLHRMEHDITLWNGNYSHVTEDGFVVGLETLLEVLGEVSGSKAVVLFSGMQDVPLELEFRRIAAAAATSRCVLYPVDVRGLTTLGTGSIPVEKELMPGAG